MWTPATRRQHSRAEQRQRRVAGPPRRRAERGEQALHRRPVDQAGNAFQPPIGTGTRRQQRLRQAALADPPLTHRRLATVADPRSESAIISTDKPFRRGLLSGNFTPNRVSSQWQSTNWAQRAGSGSRYSVSVPITGFPARPALGRSVTVQGMLCGSPRRRDPISINTAESE